MDKRILSAIAIFFAISLFACGSEGFSSQTAFSRFSSEDTSHAASSDSKNMSKDYSTSSVDSLSSETDSRETSGQTSDSSTMETSSVHTHSFSAKFAYDETHHWRTCSQCDEVADFEPHVFGEWIIDEEATEKDAGRKHRDCSVCEYRDIEAIDPLPHTHRCGEPIKENVIEATCLTNGSYDSVLYCLDCGEEVSRTPVIEKALGHNMEHHDEQEPTCTEAGHAAYEVCSRCGYSTYEELPALGHSCSEPEYAWSEDRLSCTASTECTICRQPFVETVETSYEVLVESQEGNAGVAQFVASFQSPLFSEQTLEIELKPLPSLSRLQFTLNEDGNSYSVEAIKDYSPITINIVIPETYEGLPVTALMPSAFKNCIWLRSVTIPDTISTISYAAFSDCRNLQAVIMRDDISTIDAEAFMRCSRLSSLPALNGIVSIGQEAFRYCYALSSIKISDSIAIVGAYAFDDCWKLQYTVSRNCRYLGNDEKPYSILMGVEDKNVPSIEIEEGCRVLYDYAISSCPSLLSLTVPDGVVCLGRYSISQCEALASLKLPATAEDYGATWISECPSLTSLEIPTALSFGASSLPSVKTLSFIGSGVIGYSPKNVETVVIGEGVTSISDMAFSSRQALKSVTVKSAQFSIGNEAFYKCENLVDFAFDGVAVSIGRDAFHYCQSLLSFNFAEGVESIGQRAFYSCRSLTKVELPDSLKELQRAAFYLCVNLKTVRLGDGLEHMGDDVFYNCPKLEYHGLYDGQHYLGNDENPYIAFVETGFCGDNGVSIHPDCRIIPDNAFGYRYHDEIHPQPGGYIEPTYPIWVEFSDGVRYIGGGPFHCTSVRTVILGNGLVRLASSVFVGFHSVDKILFHGDAAQWALIKTSVEGLDPSDMPLDKDDGKEHTVKECLYFYSETKPSVPGKYWHYDETNDNILFW